MEAKVQQAAAGATAKKGNTKKVFKVLERITESVFFLCAAAAVIALSVIVIFLFIQGIPALREIGLWNFISGTTWQPSANEFGILPMIVASLLATFGSALIGGFIGLMAALLLAELAPNFLANIIRPLINLLAGIPSVVYGLVGMIVLVPAVREWFHLPDGASLFAAILVLAVMILPSIISVSETALKAVPPEYEEASLGLGATWIETVFRVSVPAASSGIAASVVLGIGRAIGEAMAILMVAGNVANMPSLFKSVKFLTTAVASEMSYSAGLQRQALFSIALVLFLFIMLINVILNTLLKGKKG